MEKCVTYYQSIAICSECEGIEVSQPWLLVNNLLQGDHSTNVDWKFVNERLFSSFYQGEQNDTVLTFKYTPPKTSELLDGQMNKQSHLNQESSLESSLDLKASRKSLKNSCRSSPIVNNFPSNSNIQKTDIVSAKKDKGLWCVYSGPSTCSSNKNNLDSTPKLILGKTCSGRIPTCKSGIYSVFSKRIVSSTNISQPLNQKYDLQSLKRKFNVTDYHRGKWLISSEENTSCLWREICKLISTKDLVHCNAKYQGRMKEIWLYCDFIDSLDIHDILKSKLNTIPHGLSYSIHPHGVIMML